MYFEQSMADWCTLRGIVMTNEPKFLTVSKVKLAVTTAFELFFNSPLGERFKRQTCHVVVAVRNIEGAMEILCERSYGDTEEWKDPYDKIARAKAALLMTGRHDGRTAPMPHLLFAGDTPYWGGVEYEGLVVTCSGIQPWFDRMIAGTIAHMCVGLVYDAFELAKSKGDLPDIFK